MKPLTFLLLGASATAFTANAQAQNVPPAKAAATESNAQAGDDESTIVVQGQRPEGSVPGDVLPEITYSPADIRSFGVSSLDELLTELAPQISSTAGRSDEGPIVLLAGKRISGFSEIKDIPTEAIQRVEILPEEVALKYGYRPDQKVVNVVLRRRFKAITVEAGAGMPTEGGQFSPSIEGSFLTIRNTARINFTAKYDHSSALYESERDILVDPLLAANADNRLYRTLLPQKDAASFNAVWAKTIWGNVSASINGTVTYNESDSLQGLATADIDLPAANPYSPYATDTVISRYLDEFDPLGQKNRSISGHLGTSLNGSLGKWIWSFTGTYDHSVSRTRTDRGYDLSEFQADIDALDPLVDPFAPLTPDMVTGIRTDRARSVTNAGDVKLLFSGTLFRLPAGAVTTSLRLGANYSDYSASSLRSGISADSAFSRGDLSGQVSLDVPIASRKRGFLSPLGELSVNVNAAYEHLSDFGGLRTIGFGAHWTPFTQLSIIASINKDEGAPSMQQIGAPPVSNPNVRVFDYIQATTVDITRLSGGNPDLHADDRRVLKLGATLKPLKKSDLSITANYTNMRTDDPIASFPAATAAIEAAFPGRFTRAPDGTLLRIDSRPINFAEQDREDFRWGINFSKQISTPPRPAGGFGRPGGPGGGNGAGVGGQNGQQPNLRSLFREGQGQAQGQATATQGEGNREGESPPPDAERAAQDQGQGQEQGQRQGGFGGGPGGGAGGPGGGGRGFGGGGRGGGGPGGRGTRIQLAVYHTIHLRESVLIYDGGPTLDLLEGDAIGSSGGQSRHEVQAQAGITHNGLGARLSANWQSATTVNGGVNGSTTLHFSDLATVNLRLFANLGQQEALVKKWSFLRGSRLTVAINNLFNSRQDVRDSAGDTPISYQPDYLNPLGRSIRISFRKQFF